MRFSHNTRSLRHFSSSGGLTILMPRGRGSKASIQDNKARRDSELYLPSRRRNGVSADRPRGSISQCSAVETTDEADSMPSHSMTHIGSTIVKRNTFYRLGVLSAAIGMVLGSGAYAADSNVAGQTVGYQVDEVALISVSGNPSALVITTTVGGAAGAALADATDATTSWAITSNKGSDGKKLTAVLTANMPAHTELFVNVTAPTGGTSGGKMSLNTRETGAKAAAIDVVTGIDPVAESGKTITYTFSADVEAGVVVNANATVTFTLTNT